MFKLKEEREKEEEEEREWVKGTVTSYTHFYLYSDLLYYKRYFIYFYDFFFCVFRGFDNIVCLGFGVWSMRWFRLLTVTVPSGGWTDHMGVRNNFGLNRFFLKSLCLCNEES